MDTRGSLPEPPDLAAAWRDTNAALLDIQRRYRELVENSLGLICSHDLTGQILSVNPAAARSLGYHADEGIGRNLREFLVADKRDLFDDYLRRIREKGQDAGLMSLVSRSGDVRVWMYRNVLTRPREGAAYVLGHAVDVTERVAAERALREREAALRNAQAELEARVRARTEELEVANERLRTEVAERQQAEDALHAANARLAAADRSKNEFIAILSHELRNPLAPIRYAVPILQQERLSDGGERALAVIGRQLDHLARLVDDLLDVGRIISGKIELRRGQVTLRRICSLALERTAPGIAAGQHSLAVEIADEPIWLQGDPARLSQIVTNLLDNAAKYTPRGGQIALEAVRQDDAAVVRVRDNGIGLSSAALSQIFTMFHQVERPDGVQGGLGIGLALVRRLVEIHGGTIEARSAGLGQGAEFVVRLPLARERAERETEAGPSLAPPRAPLKVLIVDDDADLVEMLSMVVEGFGHEVRKAFDGPSAISAALSYRPGVVLLDLGLPGISGLEVGRTLKRHPETAKACLVAMTGWGQPEDRAETTAAGFNAHLRKPTDPDTLKRLLSAVCDEGE